MMGKKTIYKTVLVGVVSLACTAVSVHAIERNFFYNPLSTTSGVFEIAQDFIVDGDLELRDSRGIQYAGEYLFSDKVQLALSESSTITMDSIGLEVTNEASKVDSITVAGNVLKFNPSIALQFNPQRSAFEFLNGTATGTVRLPNLVVGNALSDAAGVNYENGLKIDNDFTATGNIYLRGLGSDNIVATEGYRSSQSFITKAMAEAANFSDARHTSTPCSPSSSENSGYCVQHEAVQYVKKDHKHSNFIEKSGDRFFLDELRVGSLGHGLNYTPSFTQGSTLSALSGDSYQNIRKGNLRCWEGYGATELTFRDGDHGLNITLTCGRIYQIQ
jgi:hypothetical protein